jgi:hypothetical protein
MEDLPQSHRFPGPARRHLDNILCVCVSQAQADLERRGFADSTMQSFMHASEFFMRHSFLMSAAIIALVLLLEWRKGGWWPRYRRAFMGTLVFLLNSAVLILIAAMLCSAMVAAPALARMKG